MERINNNVLKIYLDLKGDYTSKDVVEFKPSMMYQRSQNLGDTIYFTKTIKYTKPLFKKILFDNVGITEDPLRYFASSVKFKEIQGKLNKLVINANRRRKIAPAASPKSADKKECEVTSRNKCKGQNAMFLVKLLFKKNDEIWIPNTAGTRKMYYISNVDIRNIGLGDQIGADETVVVSLTLLNSNKPPGSIANRAYDCRNKLKDIKDKVKDKVKDKIGDVWLFSKDDDASDDDDELNASVKRIRKKTLHDQYYKVATELENIQYEKWDLRPARGNQDSAVTRATRASKTRVLVRKEDGLRRKLQEIENILGSGGMRGLRGRLDRYQMPIDGRGRPNHYGMHDYGMHDYFGGGGTASNKKNFTRRRTRIKKARHTKGARVKVKMSRQRKPKNTRRK